MIPFKVSLPHYSDPDFMEDSILRYKMYLYLKKENKDTFLVPCYDIDLVWHTHQVHPSVYHKDTVAILGYLLKHDDSVNDRADGSKLNRSDQVTRRLWSDTFGVSFSRPGSMFRGDPPRGKLAASSAPLDQSLLGAKEMTVEVLRSRVTFPATLAPLAGCQEQQQQQLRPEPGGQTEGRRQPPELQQPRFSLLIYASKKKPRSKRSLVFAGVDDVSSNKNRIAYNI